VLADDEATDAMEIDRRVQLGVQLREERQTRLGGTVKRRENCGRVGSKFFRRCGRSGPPRRHATVCRSHLPHSKSLRPSFRVIPHSLVAHPSLATGVPRCEAERA
jgi:hypothetical protein